MTVPHAHVKCQKRRFAAIAAVLAAMVTGAAVMLGQGSRARTTWSDYGGSPDSAKYSTLAEIRRTT
jgi:hypothetical protein